MLQLGTITIYSQRIFHHNGVSSAIPLRSVVNLISTKNRVTAYFLEKPGNVKKLIKKIAKILNTASV